MIRNGGISFGRADAADIESLESRLNVRLPPSYKAFLLISNGWITSTSRVVPVGNVQRFAEKDPKYVKDWHVEPGADEPNDSDYYKYGAEQLPYNIRTRRHPQCSTSDSPTRSAISTR